MSNDLFPYRLNLLRTENKMSLEELANSVGSTKASLSRYEKGERSPQLPIVGKLADFFNVDMAWLAGFSDIRKSKEDIIEIYDKLNSTNKKSVYEFAQEKLNQQLDNIINLESYQKVKLQSVVSAGTGVLDLDPHNTEEVIIYGKVPSKYDLAFQISGDSMEPLFEDGEMIYVEITEDINNGQIIVVQINEEAFIKKAYLEDGQLRLVSLNRKYEDIIANGDDDIRVIGKVIL